jgi:hypothetical protein
VALLCGGAGQPASWAQAQAASRAGHQEEALAILDGAIAEATELDLQPILAELEVLRGNVWIGAVALAEQALRAYAEAGEAAKGKTEVVQTWMEAHQAN